jgi:hypothetical protein
MPNHRCRANEKQEQTDNVCLEHQGMFVAHGINDPKPSQKTPMRIQKRVRAVEMIQGHVLCAIHKSGDYNHSTASSLRFTSVGLSQTYTGWLIVMSVVGHAPTLGELIMATI